MPARDYQYLGDNIYRIDTALHRNDMVACYLVREGDALAFIDSGTYHSVPRLLEIVAELGLGVTNVRYIIPTHVHLDHAGGAGELMARCPEATLIIHPKGAPHMIDPTRLAAGATAVYGEAAFEHDYGVLTPVSAARVSSAEDGDEINLNGRILQFFDTPGHAHHHGCIFDRRTRAIFTGDTFGISYREFDTDGGAWLFATTTPVAFDPDSWLQTLDKLEALQPSAMLLTHYGRVTELDRLFPLLRASLQDMVALALAEEPQATGRAQRLATRMQDLLLTGARAHGCTLSTNEILRLLRVDIELNAQGLEVWLQRRAKAAAPHKANT